METIGLLLVKGMEWLKKTFHCYTYHVEGMIVLIVLIGATLLTDKSWIEYIGVAAVFFTFMHATIAEYMREAEAKRAQTNGEVLVDCHHKLPYYFYAKEICWFIYFFLLGAHAALAGVIIFLLYQPWRKLWRKYHPA
jgi:hypothetical protein